MINSYGVHWNIEAVTWGRSGSLLGAASKSKNAHPVDFSQQRGIYSLYAEYDLVYIGQTGAGRDRLFKRLKMHRNDHLSERWNRFSWFGTQRVNTSGGLSVDTAKISKDIPSVLNILEAIAIAISEPRLNLQRGKWSDARKYFQYIEDQDEDYEDDL
jgi:hypothetical protein